MPSTMVLISSTVWPSMSTFSTSCMTVWQMAQDSEPAASSGPLNLSRGSCGNVSTTSRPLKGLICGEMSTESRRSEIKFVNN